MGREEFVDLLRRYAADAGAKGVLSQWETPSGRSPGQTAIDRAGWFNGLSEDDRNIVSALAFDAAHAALFGVLFVLDGVRKIDPNDQAHFELSRIKQGVIHILASSRLEADDLHDLL